MFYAIGTNYVRPGKMKEAAAYFAAHAERIEANSSSPDARLFVLADEKQNRLYVVRQDDSIESFCKNQIAIQPTADDWQTIHGLLAGHDDGEFYQTDEPLSPEQILAGVPGEARIEKDRVRDTMLRLKGSSA